MLLSRSFAQWVVLTAVILAGFADQFRVVQLGPLSGLALVTALECGVVWCCWLREPWAPARNGTIVSILLFTIWAWGTLIWAPATLQDGVTLAVFLLFLGLLLLGVREGRRAPELARQVCRSLDWMSGIAAAVCLIQVMRGATDVDSPTTARGSAIVLLVGLCYQLAAWQHGQRGRLLPALAIVAVIIVSLSRMAAGVAILLFPVAMLLGGRRGLKPIQAIQILVVSGGLISSLFLYEPIYDRILGEASLSDVRESGINSSGRMEMWEEIFDSFRQHMWLGQGIGSTRPYTDKPGMFHPHNDYLLLAHEFGLVGLGLFLLGLGLGIARIGRYLRHTAAIQMVREPGDTICLAALLAVVMLLLTMATDNSISYAFVMAPIAVLLGISFAHSSRAQQGEPNGAARRAGSLRSVSTVEERPVCRS